MGQRNLTVGRALPRVGVVAALAYGCLVMTAGGVAAATFNNTDTASNVVTPFVMTQQPLVWSATGPDGTSVSSTVVVDTAEVARGNHLPSSGVALQARVLYFYVALHPTYAFGTDPQTPVAVPTASATLTTSDGTVNGIQVPKSSIAVDGAWIFPLHGTVTSATLQVAPFTKVLGNERGDFNTWAFAPAPIAFVAGHVAGAPDVGTATGKRQGAAGGTGVTSHGASSGRGNAPGATTAVTLAAGGASILLLGAATAGTVMVRRRRAFTQADREGRVVLSGPPVLVAGGVAGGLAGAGLRPTGQQIVVKLLGPLVVDGTAREIRAGPLLEIVVFLALHPGETFTSVQIRESIWGLGRRPITANTFRKYLVQFRKAFGPGVLLIDSYRYELTGAVTSDWDQFRSLVEAEDDTGTETETKDEQSRREEALNLVRGPVLNGCFDGKKNSPFSWATKTAFDIEDEVTTVAVEVALDCLEHGEPQRATTAITIGLRCCEANLRLRMVDLQVGAALGGPREVGRRLAAGKAAMAIFPNDVVQLEVRARTFGWAPTAAG